MIREKMDAAARAAGREPREVLLCAATKMNDAARVREAVAAGVDLCGENRVQELTQKLGEHAYDGRPLLRRGGYCISVPRVHRQRRSSPEI